MTAAPSIVWQPQPRQELLLSCPVEDVLFGGSRGGGKGHPYDEVIWTPGGPRLVGELAVGDRVLNPDGGISEVLGIYELGKRAIYRVSCDDGASVQVTDDHLWYTWRVGGAPRLFRTTDLESGMLLPVAQPFALIAASRWWSRRIPPYTLGVLLGDGCLTQRRSLYVTADASMVERTGGTVTMQAPRRAGYRRQLTVMLNQYKDELARLGLGVRAEEKWIPATYLNRPTSDRWALLAGLMDSDGFVSADGKLYLSTTSPRLAQDVRRLVQTLGGRATMTTKLPRYHGGEGRRAYTLQIKLHTPELALRLPRKRARVRQPQSIVRRVHAIRRLDRMAPCRCIRVSHPQGLYLAGADAVVTHNTDGLLGDFAGQAHEWGNGAHGLLLRKTFPMLTEIIARAQELYTPLGWQYNQTEHQWTAPNGARLHFGYLESAEDVQRYIGWQVTWLGYDQLEDQATPDHWDKLLGSLRSARGVQCMRRATANPPAPAWLKQRYIDPHPQGLVPFRYTPQPDKPSLTLEAVYIPARLEDNPLLVQKDPDYERRLAAVGDRRLYEAWRFGNWDTQLGQVFEEWRAQYHVLEDFVAPRGWSFAAGCDWGYRNPGVFGLAALGPDGEIVFTHEIVFRQQTADQVGYAAGLLCRQFGTIEYVAGDEQMWYKTGVSAPTIAEEFQNGMFAAYGGPSELCPRLIPATHGRGSRAAKLVVMHRYLAWKPDVTGTVQPWGLPLLRFHKRCEYCIKTLPTLQYDPIKPEDVATDGPDHGYDMVCALLMSRPPLGERIVRVRPEVVEQHPGFDPRTRKRKRAQWERAVRQESLQGWPAAHTGYRMPRGHELVPAEEDT